MYTNVDDAMKAVDLSVEETLADQPHLKDQEDTVYWELCQAIQWDCDAPTGRELARVTGVSPVR